MIEDVRGKRKTAIVAGFIGNVVEWYDFALYGFMAPIISQLFFPQGNSALSLLATYGIFAVGFLMRPLGAGFFGWLGDTIGRSKTMLISVVMMSIPTVILGLLPSFASIGIWAPILLVALRLIQGLSVGGEFSSSVTYMVETASRDGRGLAGSWANMGSGAGMVLGSLMATAVTNMLPNDAVMIWGWRIPFILGGILGGFSILLRRHLPKSPHFSRHEKSKEGSSPIKLAFSRNIRETIQGMVFASGYGAVFYIVLVYLPTWLGEHTQMPHSQALWINTLATALLMFLIPAMGWISDHWIRRTRMIMLAMVLFALVTIPLFYWMQTGSLVSALITQLLLVVLVAIPSGAAPAMFVELFPAVDRLSGYSVSFNVGMGIVGGSTPMVITWLISKTGLTVVPAFYLFGWSLVGLLSLAWIRDRSREPLR